MNNRISAVFRALSFAVGPDTVGCPGQGSAHYAATGVSGVYRFGLPGVYWPE